MKYEVIGWTDYENYSLEDGVIDDDAVEAVIEDIRSHGYKFTGYHHQERDNCVPVLNDGLARRFSRRGFAAVMAKAHGYNEPMDYVFFMEDFSIREEALRFPTFGRRYFPPDGESEEEDILADPGDEYPAALREFLIAHNIIKPEDTETDPTSTEEKK